MTETITLERQRTSEQGTFGVLKRDGKRLAATCELPWRDNAQRQSCIPQGTYEVEPWSSKKYPEAWHLKDVPEREAILIHNGNTIRDIQGCILVGTDFGFVTGLPAVINSRVALRELKRDLPERFILEIVGVI